jgi:hypothetical protein
MRYYAMLTTFVSVALIGWYVLMTQTPFWSKATMLGLLLISFEWRFGFVVQLALGMFVVLYQTYLKARA